MRKAGQAGLPGGKLAATALAMALAACAASSPAPREGAVRVAPVERSSWDAPPEPGLYRLAFDAALSGGIRRRAAATTAQEDIDYYYAEIRVLEEEADRELKARHLCGGTTKLVRPPGGGEGPFVVLVKCRPSVF
ncbi:MAG: hypothetical protein AB7P08_06835 [Burkholderiales bacterium]